MSISRTPALPVPTSPSRRAAWLRYLVLLLTAALLALAVTPEAKAALTVHVVNTGGDGVSSRSAPQLSATNGYGAPEGATVTTSCWTWGDTVGPYSNRLWWLVSYSGRQFYVADRYLSTPNAANQPPSSEPQCGASTPPSSGSADAPQVWVGSPINGTWDLPASSGGDGPTVHHYLANATDQGDFAVDLIPPSGGGEVRLYAAPQQSGVSITARVDQTGEACSSGRIGGQFATIGFYSGSTRIGSATYGHLNLAVSQGATIDRWGTLIGHVGTGYPKNDLCWSGPHVHFQMFSTHHYACFNKGYNLGSPIKTTNFLGFTGGNVASKERQACA